MNILLSQQLLIYNLAEQSCAVERAKLAILEMLDREVKNNTNIANAEKVIQELESIDKDSLIEKQRLRMQVAAQRHTIERQLLENLEGQQRITSHREQIKSALAAREKFQFDLDSSITAHGEQQWPTNE